MKTNRNKIFFALVNAVLLYAATLVVTPLPNKASAFESVQGQDKTGKNCERKDTAGSSTFGKCESVCKGKEVTRDALNNRWVCTAYKSQVTPPRFDHATGNGQVLDAGSSPKPKFPVTAGTKASKAKKS